jgi:hypothetical protein
MRGARHRSTHHPFSEYCHKVGGNGLVHPGKSKAPNEVNPVMIAVRACNQISIVPFFISFSDSHCTHLRFESSLNDHNTCTSRNNSNAIDAKK